MAGNPRHDVKGNAAPTIRNVPLISYSSVAVPLGMTVIPMIILIPPLYTMEIGLSLALVGSTFTLVRVIDVFTDPLIGYLSDHTRGRMGRRKPWILVGALVSAFAIWKLYMPPDSADGFHLLTWCIVIWTAWTMIAIPYYAWGAELSESYHERTRIASVRTGAGLVGTLAALALPTLYWGISGDEPSPRETVAIVGTAAIALVLITTAACLFGVREGVPKDRGRVEFLKGLKLMGRNRPFLRLMLGFMLNGIAVNLPGPLYVLFMLHVIGVEMAGTAILLFFYFGNLIGVVLWNALSRRVGKLRAWLAGMCCMIFVNPIYLTLGPGDIEWVIMILLVGGIGGGAWTALPAAMKADVIDLDRLESGEDRTAQYFSVWSFGEKLIPAFAIGLSYNLLELAGFDAAGSNSPEQVWVLKILFAGLPAAFWVSAVLVMLGYPINEARQRETLQKLEKRRGVDPQQTRVD